MGACCSIYNDEITNYIDSRMSRDEMSWKMQKKLLLLGPGSAGKTTFLKMLQWIYDDEFSTEKFKTHIYKQIIVEMKKIVNITNETSNSTEHKINHDLLETAEYILSLHDTAPITKDIGDKIQILWQDQAIKETFQKRAKFGITDSSQYFFDEIERISVDDYIPNNMDVLFVRHETSGIVETSIIVKNVLFNIYDVGGQRCERKKWLQCFEYVDAVIYVADLSGYNRVLMEDVRCNVMDESIDLFGRVCNNQWFMETPIIMFLNKSDLFYEQIKVIPITCCFPDYNGSNCNESSEVLEYITHKFISQDQQNKRCNRSIYKHVTCAVDRNNIDLIFGNVRTIVIKRNLSAPTVGII
eukprot:145425_1